MTSLLVPAEDVTLADGSHPAQAVEVTRTGLFVGGAKIADRTELSSAFLVARVDDRPVLKLLSLDGSVVARLTVSDPGAGQAIRDQLDVVERAPAFTTVRPVENELTVRFWARLVVGVFAFVVLTVGSGLLSLSNGLAIIGCTLAVLWFLRWRRTVHVVAGDDGVAFAKRFFPYGSMRIVEQEGPTLRFVLFSGFETKVNARSKKAALALADHVREHRELFDAYAPPTVADRLARRPLEPPPRDSAAGAYRASAPRDGADDAMWSVVEHPFAALRARANAALALGADADDGTRARLRTVAARTASPELRLVIERIAARKDSRVALERLERDLHDQDRHAG